jgi:transporter family-2 protein
VFIAWQQAVNGRVRAAAGVVSSTLVNFLVGTAALAAALVVSVLVRGRPGALPAEPWLYTGGALGIAFIAVAAVVVPMTGVLVLGLAMIAGQVAGAVLIDLVAPVAGATLSTGEVAGAALALVAVGVAARRPPARHPATADPVPTDQAASGNGAAPAGGRDPS